MQNHVIFPSLLTLSILNGTVIYSLAEPKREPVINIALPRNSSATCEQTLTSIKADLAKQGYFIPWKDPIDRRGIIQPKLELNKTRIPQSYYDYPADRTQTIYLQLSGNPNRLLQGFMRSPRLMATIGAKIMAECEQVGLVEFSAPWEESVLPVGYFADRMVRPFTWVDIDPEQGQHQKVVGPVSDRKVMFEWGYYFSP
jgi:hypothetical protein